MEKVKKVRFVLEYPDDSPGGYVEYDGVFSKVYNEKGEFLFQVTGVFPPKVATKDYSWIEKVLERGLQDGRKRFILYVASRYLVNVKKYDEDTAIEKMKEFYYKNGAGKVYDAWLRSVVRGVKEKRLYPPSLRAIQEKDKELFEEINKALKKG
ncbi:MAG: hypothetical protein ASUL_03029 [Candidatus Aramenus sulfurataquae]|uniref:Primase X domain-containing protein n=1 Tax=Candidatus Aramenus sulfurataquae TaxID=1326980 RepID=W7KPF3_9CREN|nr:MAG: hypothetical protein ASUL_03029 [Candidatus Aramenus sulfurataquae]